DDPFGLDHNAFVTEISTQGQIIFSTYYSGSHPVCLGVPVPCILTHGSTIPASIVVDSTSNITVAGYTTVSDLPTTAGAYSRECNCQKSGFIARCAPGGSRLIWATLLPPNPGASSSLSIAGIALENDGSVVAAGNVVGGISVTAGVVQPVPASTTE